MCSLYLVQPGLASVRQYLLPPKHAYSKELQQAPGTSSHVDPRELLHPALAIAPSYFCLNYTYFFSLDLTSVSSTMVLSASTGVWTLLFSRLLLKEALTRLKLCMVLISIIGMCLVTYSAHGSADGGADGGEGESFSGDVLALMSAAASGVYMVLLPLVVPGKDSVRRMPTLFGMIGLVCAVAVLPLFPLLHFGGVERFELPPSQSAAFALVLNAATSTVLPDMLLARAVMMTSPLVATLGLSLMIPLSVMADYVRLSPLSLPPPLSRHRKC
jgi:solute carrier family 35 protein F5